ncbi:39S ribosomal protein L22, mitochondrial-like isoform X1 [Coffea eugenioides]|uniref:Large ribosomal subunit protein uL22c n=1 Tax=Coffea arabica TaxID=13443 RepID=A0A6P6SS97_COFAR|nr:39S ribosomal protein L22, mitochondrial-like isoform X1 [Coffea eugenioides]XP_027175290.1 39S ribosomal protein L22, mitochondrial-like isoform X1 [Coffea eugenioides]
MVGWQRHLQSLLRQAGRRLDQSRLSPLYSFYHSKAAPGLAGEAAHRNILWSSHFHCTTRPLYHYVQQLGFTSTRKLLADSSNETPISSPLTPALALSGGKAEPEKPVSKPSKVQAVLKGIKQSPKKVNLVAALVRGMRVEDALLQLQVTVKRASKTVYQVIHSARANATHNHGLDPDRLLVAEAFVGKGFYRKRVSYHAKGRCGVKVRPECRLTVVLREITPEEEAEIAKLRVHNFRKLTKREKRLVPHQLIETTPIWSRKSKSKDAASDAMAA